MVYWASESVNALFCKIALIVSLKKTVHKESQTLKKTAEVLQTLLLADGRRAGPRGAGPAEPALRRRQQRRGGPLFAIPASARRNICKRDKKQTCSEKRTPNPFDAVMRQKSNQHCPTAQNIDVMFMATSCTMFITLYMK